MIAVCLPGEAFAALYKCGNVFQDRPCDTTADQQVLKPSGRPMTPPPARVASVPVAGASAPASAAVAPVAAASAPTGPGSVRMSCFRAGEHAQLVQWKREGGASRDNQLSEVRSRRDAIDAASVIHQVYERKGSAIEIRKAIEAMCVQNGGVQAAR